jgi:hypothetical protein
MAYNKFLNKVRYWDNMVANWITRHFYTLFFQIILVIIFLVWFVNLFSVIDLSVQIPKANTTERILMSQSINSTILVFLLILNSFWILFIFNGIIRLRTLLRDINYNINRMRTEKNFRNKNRPSSS